MCSPLFQYRVLFARFAKAYWRNPAVNLSRLGAAVISAFLIGTWFWMLADNYGSRADTRVRTTWRDVNHGLQPALRVDIGWRGCAASMLACNADP